MMARRVARHGACFWPCGAWVAPCGRERLLPYPPPPPEDLGVLSMVHFPGPPSPLLLHHDALFSKSVGTAPTIAGPMVQAGDDTSGGLVQYHAP